MLLQRKNESRDGELEIAERVDAADRDVGGLALEPIEEVRIDEQPRQRVLDAALEVAAFLPPETIELEQQLNLGAVRRHRPPIRARREPRENLSGARRFRGRGGRLADENLAAARRVAGARRRRTARRSRAP